MMRWAVSVGRVAALLLLVTFAACSTSVEPTAESTSVSVSQAAPCGRLAEFAELYADLTSFPADPPGDISSADELDQWLKTYVQTPEGQALITERATKLERMEALSEELVSVLPDEAGEGLQGALWLAQSFQSGLSGSASSSPPTLPARFNGTMPALDDYAAQECDLFMGP